MSTKKTLGAGLAALAVIAPAASAATIPAGPGWGIINRNTIGAATAQLRTGPVPAPLGVGSVQLDVASGADKISWGNETDFAGRPLAGIESVAFGVYQTGENIAIAPGNLPNVAIEIDPTGAADGTAPNYSTLNGVSPVAPADRWSVVESQLYWLTGTAGTTSGFDQSHPGTLAQIQAAFPQATILTVAISKGRDNSWHGAVDALRINDDVYDFEPFTAAPAGPGGQDGQNGAPGAPGVTTTVTGTVSSEPVLAGNRVRFVAIRKLRGLRLVSATAILRGARLPVRGYRVRVDLRDRTAGRYQVKVTARYRTAKGQAVTRRQATVLVVSRVG
ncbi:MAG: hypothetical protein AB7V42_01875 [Thermoleophilia bacterium]